MASQSEAPRCSWARRSSTRSPMSSIRTSPLSPRCASRCCRDKRGTFSRSTRNNSAHLTVGAQPWHVPRPVPDQSEIYLRRFPPSDGMWQISTGGGATLVQRIGALTGTEVRLLSIHDELDLVAVGILDHRVTQVHDRIAIRRAHERAAVGLHRFERFVE